MIPPFYALGIVCSVYHLANGIWTTLITWGITVGPNAQRKAGYVCAVFGVVLGLVGLGTLREFTSLADKPSGGEAQAQDEPARVVQHDGG